MAFVKACMGLLLLLSVASMAEASSDVETIKFCSDCVCTKSVPPQCSRTDFKIGSCPFTCGDICPCTRSIPPQCRCTYEVESCDPKSCTAAATGARLGGFLGLI